MGIINYGQETSSKFIGDHNAADNKGIELVPNAEKNTTEVVDTSAHMAAVPTFNESHNENNAVNVLVVHIENCYLLRVKRRKN